MSDFVDWFGRATGGRMPYGYQRRIAEAGLPDVLEVPMGAGKTAAVILGWLWRKLEITDADVRRATPRRLVYALPMRTLVEQVAGEVSRWLTGLGLEDQVQLHVVMGGRQPSPAWRLEPQRPTIVVGTVDAIMSRALVRGYGISRSSYPMDFALVTNGAHIVLDEVQLAPASTVTARQIAAFQRRYGTAEPVGLTCMSATVDYRLLDTVDNPVDPESLRAVRFTAESEADELLRRMNGVKTVRRIGDQTPTPRDIAAAAVERHRPGTRTLVVANTVKSAVEIHAAARRLKPAARLLLVHSRFRPVERAALTDELVGEPGEEGVIVVATQVVEAGVDIDSAVLITEAAPWPAVCQRTGRCNRYGQLTDAEVWWYPPLGKGPYETASIDRAAAVLSRLEGSRCSSLDLLAQAVQPDDLDLHVLRRPDFLALFDTTPDLSGADIDIGDYIRDADQLDCQLAWIGDDLVEVDGAPRADYPGPGDEWRCSVPVAAVREFAQRRGVRAWVLDPVMSGWGEVRSDTRIVPGQLILVHAESGGYRPDVGFDPTSKDPVGTTVSEVDQIAPSSTDVITDESGSVEGPGWLSLDQHLQETGEQAAALCAALQDALAPELVPAVVAAAALHDIGKAHSDWQDALRATAADPPSGLLAKSPGSGRLVVAGRPGFRHELISALMLGCSAGRPLLESRAGLDPAQHALVRYLAAAHHGKVRMQVRAAQQSLEVSDRLLGVSHGERVSMVQVLGHDVEEWTVDLDGLKFAGPGSWPHQAVTLRDHYGPFVLAYLETLVRIADWRASSGLATVEAAEA